MPPWEELPGKLIITGDFQNSPVDAGEDSLEGVENLVQRRRRDRPQI